MSVINTMLQDLELRNAGTGAAGAYRYVRPLPAGGDLAERGGEAIGY